MSVLPGSIPLHQQPISAIVRRAFNTADKTRRGRLNLRELQIAFGEMDLKPGQTLALMRQFNADKNQQWDMYEFNNMARELRRGGLGIEAAPRPMTVRPASARMAAAGSGGLRGCRSQGSRYQSIAQDVRNAFERFDRDGSGGLDVCELHSAFREMGFDPNAPFTTAVMRRYDTDRNRRLDINEFDDLVQEMRRQLNAQGLEIGQPAQPEFRIREDNARPMSRGVPMRSQHSVDADVRRAFDMFDRDGSGGLDVRELHKAFGAMGFQPNSPATMAAMRQFDTDGDRRLDVYEFSELVIENTRTVSQSIS